MPVEDYVASVQYFVKSEPLAHARSPEAAQQAGVPLRHVQRSTGSTALPFLFAICKVCKAADIGYRIQQRAVDALQQRLQPHGIDVQSMATEVNASRVAQLHRIERASLKTPKKHPDGGQLIALDISDAPCVAGEEDVALEAEHRAKRIGCSNMVCAAEPVMLIDPCQAHPSQFEVPRPQAEQMVKQEKYLFFAPVFASNA